jgi:hypothetical protein
MGGSAAPPRRRLARLHSQLAPVERCRSAGRGVGEDVTADARAWRAGVTTESLSATFGVRVRGLRAQQCLEHAALGRWVVDLL